MTNSDTTNERTKPAPPPSPEDGLLHGLLGEIVAAANPTTEADPVGVYVSLLAGVGVLVGPGPYVQVANTRHPLLIWPLLFGRTGSGRKGEAWSTAKTFLRSFGDDYSKVTVTGLSSGEGLIERIRDPRDKDDPGGTKDKRLLVIEPEFTTVMARAKKEGSTLAHVLRLAWDGDGLAALTRTPYRASSSHVGIVGHVTPKEFRLRKADADMSGGTFNRFLPIYVERSKLVPLPKGVDQVTVTALSGRLIERVGEASKIGRITFTQGAEDLWVSGLYREFAEMDDDDHPWTEFTRRAAPYCLRIGALHAALEGRDQITESHLSAAAALVRYSIASAKFVLDVTPRDPRLDRLRRAIDSAGNRGISKKDMFGLFARNLTKDQLDALTTELTNEGDYEWTRVQTGGRPAEALRRKPRPAVRSFVRTSAPDEAA